ncbi:778_t:CDS:2 [Entrophospora sp. SA101]|nr:778_t:CDS:2 [Entrophospora sp. SA101]
MQNKTEIVLEMSILLVIPFAIKMEKSTAEIVIKSGQPAYPHCNEDGIKNSEWLKEERGQSRFIKLVPPGQGKEVGKPRLKEIRAQAQKYWEGLSYDERLREVIRSKDAKQVAWGGKFENLTAEQIATQNEVPSGIRKEFELKACHHDCSDCHLDKDFQKSSDNNNLSAFSSVSENNNEAKREEIAKKLVEAKTQGIDKKEIERLRSELQKLNQQKEGITPAKNNNELILGIVIIFSVFVLISGVILISQLLYQKNKIYAFYVLPSANKFQIKQELEKMFQVKIKKVRTSRHKPVLRQTRYLQKSPTRIYTKLKKKAFVELMPGQNRNTILIDYREKLVPNSQKSPRQLLKLIQPQSGRNNQGKITMRHQGGRHKRFYRVIDFKRYEKDNVEGKVKSIEYDPNRNSFISLISYRDGSFTFIITPEGLKINDQIISGSNENIPLKIGNNLPLSYIPVNIPIHNLELKPQKGGQLIRGAGTYAEIIGKEEGNKYVLVKLMSKEVRKVLATCRATIGSAMNPCDHPHGGGEQKAGIGHPSPLTTYEEGKIKSIGGIAGKISAAVEKGCDTIVIPKSNSSDYRDEVPLSIRTKVKKLHKVENYEDLKNLFLAGL